MAPARAGEAFELVMPLSEGMTGLALRGRQRTAPGPSEVEVAVKAVGLNFREVIKAVGALPGEAFSNGRASAEGVVTFDGDCAGTVVSVGPSVETLRPGDEVMGLGARVFGSHAIVPADLLIAKPANLSWVEAATLPVVATTALHALLDKGRIEPGMTILIHAATGGVGSSAVQICLSRRLLVLATASSAEKHAALRTQGVEAVFSSRSLAFVDEVLAHTEGRGVDLILNSLSGAFMRRNLDILALGGCMLELGKADIYGDGALPLLPFRNNLSFHAIDLERRPAEFLQDLLRRMIDEMDSGRLVPLRHQVFPIEAAREAFQLMRRAKHIGKVVLSVGETIQVEATP